MKLYYSPLACSLADHIALEEAGVSFERESVNLKTKRTGSGDDFTTVTRKGYVPALVLDSGETLTENIAVLDWIASQYPPLGVAGPLGRTRLLEALAYVSMPKRPRRARRLRANSSSSLTGSRPTICSATNPASRIFIFS
ncbi:glutathione S-transferase N-terminal domain-containing protein [Mesorhizobium sp. M1233]|uniref:glutathione S-transferase N-terminal domain-containing protein n=1 Tax=unclassified Mesorhizobium TaxID=325217 RepID=UPI00333B6564